MTTRRRGISETHPERVSLWSVSLDRFISGVLLLQGMDSSRDSWRAVTLITLMCTAPVFGQLDGAKLDRGNGLERTKLQPSGSLKRPTLKTLALDIVKGELSPAELQAAASSIPPSKLGEMFFGVAQELEKIEKKITATSMGYYMAALTVPDGPKYEAAKQRIREVVLQKGLSAEDAMRLYDGGRAQFEQLYRGDLGITKSDAVDAVEVLRKIKE